MKRRDFLLKKIPAIIGGLAMRPALMSRLSSGGILPAGLTWFEKDKNEILHLESTGNTDPTATYEDGVLIATFVGGEPVLQVIDYNARYAVIQSTGKDHEPT